MEFDLKIRSYIMENEDVKAKKAMLYVLNFPS